jgi:predicted nucleic acid-binding protein
MAATVVVDASLATMWAVPETYSEQALRLADLWAHGSTRLVAPCLLLAEVTNALYKRVVRGEIDLETAETALQVVLGFAVEIREEPGLAANAMSLARQLRRPATYDCHYLALAERYQRELWTGDERFYNAVKLVKPSVKWVGSYTALSST